jgi:hypothetical protein
MRGGRSVMLGLVLGMMLPGCSRAPQVPFDNLQYSAALLTAASSRSPEQLDRVAAAIERDSRSGQIGEAERAAYEPIIAAMRSERWTEAEEACRRFRKAQLLR